MSEVTEVRIDLRDVEFPADIGESSYANNVLVTHTAWDFSLVFAHVDLLPTPCDQQPRYTNRAVSKVVLSPEIMKSLIQALQTNVEKYENMYGVELPGRRRKYASRFRSPRFTSSSESEKIDRGSLTRFQVLSV